MTSTVVTGDVSAKELTAQSGGEVVSEAAPTVQAQRRRIADALAAGILAAARDKFGDCC